MRKEDKSKMEEHCYGRKREKRVGRLIEERKMFLEDEREREECVGNLREKGICVDR